MKIAGVKCISGLRWLLGIEVTEGVIESPNNVIIVGTVLGLSLCVTGIIPWYVMQHLGQPFGAIGFGVTYAIGVLAYIFVPRLWSKRDV